MTLLSDLPKSLPLFPLPGALLLPRSRLPLHIFEPRYLAMFDDAFRSESRLIGMIQTIGDEGDDMYGIGCAGRITAFTETVEKTYMVTLTGICRFHLSDVQEGFSPYLRTDANWSEFTKDLTGAEQDPGLDRTALLALLSRFFDQSDLAVDWNSLKNADGEMLINSLAAISPFEVKDKQMLLEARTLAERRAMLTTLMEFALRGGTGKDRLQ